MFIKIKDLELRKTVFDQRIQPGIIDFGPDFQQKTALHAAGRAELIRENRGSKAVVEDIRIVATLSTQVEIRCARCLEPVKRDVNESFDLIYRPLGVDARGEDVSISTAETEIGYYQGEGLLLEDVLKEQILLALPVKLVCSTDCKGLCPQCGRNLNAEQCDCVTTMPDPRWAALEDIRKKLEH